MGSDSCGSHPVTMWRWAILPQVVSGSAWTRLGVDKGLLSPSSGHSLSPCGGWDRLRPSRLDSRVRMFRIHRESAVQVKDPVVRSDPKEYPFLVFYHLGESHGTFHSTLEPSPFIHWPVSCSWDTH
jgi:hypothetical protein